jgi:mRNA interferase RelE/StbE
VWRVVVSKSAQKTLEKLGANAQKEILLYLYERVTSARNPKQLGKPLTGKLKGLWRYRVGDYRIICQIRDETVTVLVLDIGHRKEIYR